MVESATMRAKKTLVSEQPRIIKYFPRATQKAVASNFGNIETQRQILLSHVEVRHPGMVSLFTDDYYREIDVFIEFIEQKFPEEVESAENRKLGLTSKEKKIALKKRDKKTQQITSKTKSGKKYVRQKSRRFENKRLAVAFIKEKVAEGKSNKEITKSYNLWAKNRGWDERTQSSIVTLKSREGIKSKNRR